MSAPDSQAAFRKALLDPRLPEPARLHDGAGRPAGSRFAVYRNNVVASLTEAMHLAFPAIAKLLGKENMDGLAGLYLRAHPPRSPLMMHYGDDFPGFLEAQPALAHLPYLPCVARLELALRRSYHAADAAPADPQALSRIAPEDLGRVSLTLAPAVEVLRSPWPAHAIWAWNMAGGPKPGQGGQEVLITRTGFDPVPEPMPQGGANFVTALQQGATLGEATEAAPEGFGLAALLGALLRGGAITGLELKET